MLSRISARPRSVWRFLSWNSSKTTTAVPASPTSEAPPAAELPTGEAVQPVPDDGGDDGVPVLPATAAGLLVLATGAAAAQLLRRPG